MTIAPHSFIKRLDKYLTKLIFKPFLGDLFNSIMGTGKGLGKAEDWANRTMTEAAPWNVSGPFGNIGFDAETRQGTFGLTPEQQTQSGMFTSMIQPQLDYVNSLGADPFQAGTQIYNQMVDATQPGFMDQYHSLESRGEAQGRGGLGMSGRGNPQMQALFEARERAKSGMMSDALGISQQLRTGGINTAMGLLQPQQQQYSNLMQLANLGPSIGQGIGSLASQQGQVISGAYGANDKMMGDIIGSIAGGWAQGKAASDERLKKNIKQVGILSSGIKLYTWEWNDIAKKLGINPQNTFGVLAQEVKKIIPDAVIKFSDGYYRVDYSKVA